MKRWIAFFVEEEEGRDAIQFVFRAELPLNPGEIELEPHRWYSLVAVTDAECGEVELSPLTAGIDQGFPTASVEFEGS